MRVHYRVRAAEAVRLGITIAGAEPERAAGLPRPAVGPESPPGMEMCESLRYLLRMVLPGYVPADIVPPLLPGMDIALNFPGLSPLAETPPPARPDLVGT